MSSESRRRTQELPAQSDDPRHIVIGRKLAREFFEARGCDAKGFAKLNEVEFAAVLALAAQLGGVKT
jgi:hypothetical protein